MKPPKSIQTKIIEYVSEEYGLSCRAISSGEKSYSVSIPRMAAMALLYKHCFMSLKDVGLKFNRDGSTACYAMKRVREMLQIDAAFAKRYHNIELRIHNEYR